MPNTTNPTTPGTTHVAGTNANGEEKSKVAIGAPHQWTLTDANNNVLKTIAAPNRIALFFTTEQTFVAERLNAVQKRNVLPTAADKLAKLCNDWLLNYEDLADETADKAGAEYDRAMNNGAKFFHMAGEKKGQEKTRQEYIAEQTKNTAEYLGAIQEIDKQLKKLMK